MNAQRNVIGAEIADNFQASFLIEGAHVLISAPTLALLGTLTARVKGETAAPVPAAAQEVPPADKPVAKPKPEPKAESTAAQRPVPPWAEPPKAPAPASQSEASAPATETPKAETAPTPTTASASVASTTAEAVTQEMVNKATVQLVAKAGVATAKNVLTSFGLAKASEATEKCPEKMAELHAALTAAAGA